MTTINDREWAFLSEQTGMSAPFNDMYFNYLRGLNYTGTLQDMISSSGLGLTPSKNTGNTPPWVPENALGYWDFINNNYWNGEIINAPSCSRASPGFTMDSEGVWQSFENDEPRIADTGLLIEPASTNVIRNNSMAGASSPSTLPTNGWDGFNGSGVSRQVVGTGTEFGLPYVDIRWWTPTTAASTGSNLRFETATQIVAAQGQTWTQSVFARLAAGSMASVSMRLMMQECTADGSVVGAAHYQSPTMTQIGIDAILRRYDMTVTMDRGETAVRARPSLEFTYANGSAFDFTIRLYAPQMELASAPSSPILTVSAATTRAADVNVIDLPSGINDLTFTFDDDSSQIIADQSGNYVIPTNLNRRLIKTIEVN